MTSDGLTAERVDALGPRDAAALFIARKATGLTASEQRLLEDWLADDEAHRRAFEGAERAWQVFDDLGDDEIIAAMRARARAPRRRALPHWWLVAAAAALVLVALSFVFIGRWTSGSADRQGLASNVGYSSAIGEVKNVQLDDGTRMTLDADSAAVASFTSGGRSITLQKGRALFAVQPDHSRPFVVSAGRRSIAAVGTQFDVNIVPDGLIVSLFEGSVVVASLDDGRALVTLSPGQQFVERSGKAIIRALGANTENSTAWRDGLINFDDQPLSEAAAIMNRYSSDQIVIDATEVATISVSGQFRAGDTQRFADTLAEMHGLRAVRHGERIELDRVE